MQTKWRSNERKGMAVSMAVSRLKCCKSLPCNWRFSPVDCSRTSVACNPDRHWEVCPNQSFNFFLKFHLIQASKQTNFPNIFISKCLRNTASHSNSRMFCMLCLRDLCCSRCMWNTEAVPYCMSPNCPTRIPKSSHSCHSTKMWALSTCSLVRTARWFSWPPAMKIFFILMNRISRMNMNIT